MVRILGSTGSRRRRRYQLGAIFSLVALMAVLAVPNALAVHTAAEGFFELGPTPTAPEANITNILGNSTDPGPDWADLFDAAGAKKDVNPANGTADCEESPGKECAFIADPSSAAGATDPSTFSGFGTSNKNNDPVSTADCAARTPPLTGSDCSPWGWDPGNVPAKDDLTNVYAYEVIPTTGSRTGHAIIYGGIEREDPSGDSHVDLEFFQSPVGLCSPSPCSSFTGIRTVGDIVISMDFLKGGSLGAVTVRKWDGTAYALQGSAAGEGCFTASGAPGDDICAFNNGASIDGGPWPNFNNHGAVITSLQKNAFTEIGVDLFNVLNENPCIATFMGKTRSSGSFTSELKDFAGPTTFSVCAPSTLLTKTATDPTTGDPVTTVHSGDSVKYVFAEKNDGKDPLTNVTVSDDKCTVPATPDTKSGGNQDNILDPGETWTYSCTVVLTATTTNTATGSGFDTLLGKTVTFCADPNNPPTGIFCDAEEQAQATVTVISPSTSLRKTAQVDITYTYKESNTGDDPLTNVVVSDDKCSPLVRGTDSPGDNDNILEPGETWVFTCTASSTDGVDYNVTNTATATGIDSLGGTDLGTDESDSVTVTVTHKLPN